MTVEFYLKLACIMDCMIAPSIDKKLSWFTFIPGHEINNHQKFWEPKLRTLPVNKGHEILVSEQQPSMVVVPWNPGMAIHKQVGSCLCHKIRVMTTKKVNQESNPRCHSVIRTYYTLRSFRPHFCHTVVSAIEDVGLLYLHVRHVEHMASYLPSNWMIVYHSRC